MFFRKTAFESEARTSTPRPPGPATATFPSRPVRCDPTDNAGDRTADDRLANRRHRPTAPAARPTDADDRRQHDPRPARWRPRQQARRGRAMPAIGRQGEPVAINPRQDTRRRQDLPRNFRHLSLPACVPDACLQPDLDEAKRQCDAGEKKGPLPRLLRAFTSERSTIINGL
jgi:hypothetical protein